MIADRYARAQRARTTFRMQRIVGLVSALAWLQVISVGSVATPRDGDLADAPRQPEKPANRPAPPAVLIPADRTTAGIERLLVTTDHRWLLVDLRITVDGVPFQEPRRALVTRLLAGADKDRDGSTSIKEAAASPDLQIGGLRYLARHRPASVTRRLSMLDDDGNGLLDHKEASRLVALYGNTPLLTVNQRTLTNAYYHWDVRLFSLLDSNNDGRLSAAERDKATVRLLMHDRDDSEVLESTEILAVPLPKQASRRLVAASAKESLLRIVPGADPQRLVDGLRSLAGDQLTRKQLAAAGGLFDRLDQDRDDNLSAQEVARLRTIAPDLQLAIHLGQPRDLPQGGSVERIASPLKRHVRQQLRRGLATSLRFPRLKLSVTTTEPPRVDAREQQITELLARDQDNNGTIERSELGDEDNPLVEQFELWDESGDGRVTRAELRAYLDLYGPPPQKRRILVAPPPNRGRLHRGAVRLSVHFEGGSLFRYLDTNSDRRLGIRELRQADSMLNAADFNEDGVVTPDEIPHSVEVMANPARVMSIGLFPGRNPVKIVRRGPEWFRSMDKNGDGDLSSREFLGGAQEFHKLDADKDGLVDLDEAKASSRR